MTTGTLPLSGDTSAGIFDAILHKEPTAPVRLNPETPAALEAMIKKCLERDRDLRYQQASEIRTDLKRLKRDTDSARHLLLLVAIVAIASNAAHVARRTARLKAFLRYNPCRTDKPAS